MTNGKPRMPGGIKFLVGNEAVERYTFYAMRTILVIYMTKYLAPNMTEPEAKEVFHLFNSANYFFPILGSFLADLLIGRYMTVLSLSWVYAIGCAILALVQTRFGLWTGLGLIALGSGGIKPIMMAMVGDQFTKENSSLFDRATNYFYLSIQAGGFASIVVSPIVLDHYGARIAFGIPAILMVVATTIFWLGKGSYVHTPPNPKAFKKEILSREGIGAILKISLLLVFMAGFFSLYDQTGSSWVLQAEKMDRRFLGIDWLEAQVQIINPVLILVLVPIFDIVIYPLVGKVIRVTPLRRISLGMFLLIPTFLITAQIQQQIDWGYTLNIKWQLLAWTLLTAGEVLAYSTALGFFYSQAPKQMKSTVQGLFMLSISAGNLFTAGINWGISNVSALSSLTGASYYFFFSGVMTVFTIAFIVTAVLYKEKTYLQDDQSTAPPEPQ